MTGRHLTAALLLLTSLQCWANYSLEDGYDAFEQGNVAKAIGIWAQLADAGDATAQLNLGQIYRLGNGVEQNDAEAIKWYIMAAQNGSKTAAANLMLMEQEGRASREEVAQAFVNQQPGQSSKPTAPAASPATQTTANPRTVPAPVAPAIAQVTKPQTVNKPAPAPIASIAKPAMIPAPKPTAQNTQVARAGTMPKPAAKAPKPQRAWINTVPRKSYVIQLLKSADAESLSRYAESRLRSVKTAEHIVPTVRGLKKEYLLLLGPYNTKAQADHAFQTLPASVKQGMPWAGGQPWVRTAESVQRISG